MKAVEEHTVDKVIKEHFELLAQKKAPSPAYVAREAPLLVPLFSIRSLMEVYMMDCKAIDRYIGSRLNALRSPLVVEEYIHTFSSPQTRRWILTKLPDRRGRSLRRTVRVP